jgi:hypothetical protein
MQYAQREGSFKGSHIHQEMEEVLKQLDESKAASTAWEQEAKALKSKLEAALAEAETTKQEGEQGFAAVARAMKEAESAVAESASLSDLLTRTEEEVTDFRKTIANNG